MIFLDVMPKTKEIFKKIKKKTKLDFIKITQFCAAKDTIAMKRNETYRLEENICKYYLLKNSYLEYKKNYYNPTTKNK